ncbi:MAG TPA: peptide ABC transporter substrate-binding protein [Candidatus Baltobacteraceae bacterium]|nr:peptide ABC transporter substrate-binding protein [Candidatus Baltobacteraceae bacterium]
MIVEPGFMLAVRRAAIAVVAVLLASCARMGQTTYHSGSDTLHVGTAIEPNSFNPLLATESIENDLDRLVFNGLTLEDDRNTTQPDLATVVPTQRNGGISKDGKTITYHLRKNVRWQDGVPFTSRDVKFTWQAIMNPNTLVGNRLPYDQVSSVDTPDAYTVVFHLKKPFAPFVAEAFNSSTIEYVIPEHLLKSYPDLNKIPFNYKPVGTGPYRMLRWAHGDRIEFAANQRYFKGAPKIANIVIHEIPQENTGLNELRTGEIQWYPYISEASYNLIKGAPGIRIVVTPQNAYRAIYINTERPILSDVRVRQAIAYAVDKKELVEKVTHGTGIIATEDIPSFMWAYDKGVPVDGYDPAKARALLDAAGWHTGSSGIRTRDGRALAFTLALRQGASGDNAMAVLVQSWLRDIGMQVSIKSYPGSMLFAIGPSGVLQPGKYDLDISGFTSPADPDNSAEFTCAARPPNGFNWTRYCNPEMDRLQATALTTYDQAARKAAYAKIETLLARDVPQVYIYYQPQISAVDERLQNFKPSMITPMWNAQQWSFSPR